MLPDKLQVIGLNGLSLKKGSHTSRDNGVCAMEAVAWLAGEPHGDHPRCASPVITSFVMSWNDRLGSDADRDRLLKPLLPHIIGTKASGKIENKRSEMLRDWSLQVALPLYLEAAKLHDSAQEVIDNPGDLTVIRKARDAAWAKRIEHRGVLREKVTAAVKEALSKRPAAAVAAAAADADADAAAAVAVAAVAAVAVAAADAAADADADAAAAAATATATAAAAAVAAADAAAVAAVAAVAVAAVAAADVAAVAGSNYYWAIRNTVYTKLYEIYIKAINDDARFSFVGELQDSAQQLVRDMCALSDSDDPTESEIAAVGG